MDNEVLKLVFRNMNDKIIREVNPDSAIDNLFARQVISDNDYHDLYDVTEVRGRCRKLFARLYRSTHPATFIHIREALRSEYPQLVDEVDEQLTAMTSQQPRRLHRRRSAGSMFLLS